MFRNLTIYEILEKKLQNPKKLSDGKNVLSCGYNIGRHFWTVMVTSLSQLLIGKCLLLNLLLNLLFQTSKSYKSSTDFEEPPIFFLSFFWITILKQLPYIYISYISAKNPFPFLVASLRNILLTHKISQNCIS